MELQLESYVFKILENQKKLYDFLGEFDWGFDIDSGLLSFTNSSGELILECPVQIIGTEGEAAKSWLWAWANTDSEIPAQLLKGCQALKQTGQEVFTIDELELTENLGAELSIIASGFLQHFTYFGCDYDGGCMYVSIEQSPDDIDTVSSTQTILAAIQLGISSLTFNHKEALIAYLGESYTQTGDEYSWVVNEQALVFKFDEQDRIANIQTTI